MAKETRRKKADCRQHLGTDLLWAEALAPPWEEAQRRELAWTQPRPLDSPINEAFHTHGTMSIPQDISTLSPEQRNYLKRSVQKKQMRHLRPSMHMIKAEDRCEIFILS